MYTSVYLLPAVSEQLLNNQTDMKQSHVETLLYCKKTQFSLFKS